MNLDDFRHHLDQYGSDLDTWPGNAQDSALALIKTNQQAAQLLTQLQEQTTALRQAMAEPAPPFLAERTLAQVRSKTTPWRELFAQTWWRPVLASAVPLVFGFGVGMADQDSLASIDEEISALTYIEFPIDDISAD